jgi:tetratricopeptide (TPR) repeat protein
MNRLLLGAALVLVLAIPASAQEVNPEAKDLFTKAITAANANDFANAVNNLKLAYTKDPKIMALPDNGALEKITSGLKAQAGAKPGDVQTGKDLGWVYALRGQFKEGLDEYKKIEGAAGGDPEVKEQIRVLEAYVQQTSGGGGGSSASGGGSSATGSGGASGGGAGGSSGGDSSGGGGGASGGGGGGAGGGAGGAGDGTGGNPEVSQLKEQLAKKDEEIQALNTEKEELTKKVSELEGEIQKLQIYKTRVNQAGGLR